MRSTLEGQAAIVTGGGRGIGLGIARRLAEEGCQVALWDVDFASFDAAKAGFKPAHLQAVNVADIAAVERAFTATEKALGKIDILVNNAGINGPVAPTWEYPLDAWDKVLAVDLTGVFYCCRVAASGMRARLWPHCQRRVDRRQGRQCGHRGLCRGQGRRDRVHQIARARAR